MSESCGQWTHDRVVDECCGKCPLPTGLCPVPGTSTLIPSSPDFSQLHTASPCYLSSRGCWKGTRIQHEHTEPKASHIRPPFALPPVLLTLSDSHQLPAPWTLASVPSLQESPLWWFSFKPLLAVLPLPWVRPCYSPNILLQHPPKLLFLSAPPPTRLRSLLNPGLSCPLFKRCP